MCGFIGVKGKRIDNAAGLVDILKHRGPDDSGYFQKDDLFLGHVRLAIQDVSENGRQPMCDCDEEVRIIFNGEIYNFHEIRRELEEKGVRFKSQTDTEVLIYLYRLYGIAFLNRLRGMFAFAIIDTQKERIILARDRFGKKPLYYCCRDGAFIFSSEIKAILKALPSKPEIDTVALGQYLSYLAALPPRTFFKGIHKLEAGYYLIYEKGEIKEHKQYYDPLRGVAGCCDSQSAQERISETLLESVRHRLVSDVEVGVFLSGGLDSSLLTALYQEISPRRVHTFSIGYDDYRKRYDELDFAQLASSHLDTEHHPLVVCQDDFVQALEEVIYHLDEPVNDPAAIPTYLLAKWVRDNGIKVCLSGEGSDELFLGYSIYPQILEYCGLTGDTGNGTGPDPVPLPVGCFKDEEYLRRACTKLPVYRTIGEFFALDDSQKNRIMVERALPDASWEGIAKYSDAFAGYRLTHADSALTDVLKWCSYIDLKVWIPEVLMMKVDKMAMAHGVEVRAPFLDHDLVELAFSIPSGLLLDKAPLRTIAAAYLPPEISGRRKKGFSSPFLEWFYSEYGDEILLTVQRVNRKLGLFRDEGLSYFFEQGKQGACKHVIWGLYLFARWCEAYDMV
ncbi:MAG: asparagine synthase (glutamine-hydrolyzing) [Syntrophobacteraceae bacterium]